MKIVSPGPWQHLPPAQAPMPAPRSWYRSKATPGNPFEQNEGAVGGSAHDGSDSNGSDAASTAAAAEADVAPSEDQSDSLPRSLSVPVLASKREGDQAAPRQAKVWKDVSRVLN